MYMRKTYLLLLLCCFGVRGFATTYYNKAAGVATLQNPANWGTNSDGSGTAPVDFSTSTDVFNLTNGAAGTITVAWSVAGTLNVGDGTNNFNLTIPATAGVTLTMGATGVNVFAGSTLTLSNTTIPTLGTLDVASTVIYNTSTQIVTSATYGNLKAGNSSGTITAGGTITVNGTLTTTSGGTFALSTFQLLGSLTAVTHNGIITTTSIANPAIPSGKNWSGGTTGTITFAKSTGGQFIPIGSYKTLTCSANTSGTNTVVGSGTLTVTGVFSTAGAGGTMDLGTNDLSAGTITNNVTGTIKTQSTSSTPLPSGKVIAGIVNYNAATGGQTIVSETSYATLTIGNTTGTQTAGGNLVVNTALNVTNSGATLDMTSAYTLLGTLTTVTNNGTIKTAVPTSTSATPINTGKTWGGTGTIEYNGTADQTIVAGTYNDALLISGSRGGATITFASGTVSIGTSITITASSFNYDLTSNLINYSKATGGLTVNSAIPYNDLTMGNTSNTNTANGNITVAGVLTTTAGGSFDLATNTLSVTGAPVNAGTILTQNTSATPITAGKTWAGTINYNGTGAQTMVTGTFTNLTLSGARASTPTITLASGAINCSGNFTVSYTGTVSFSNTGNTFTYTGNTANTVGGITYYDLAFTNTSATKTAGAAVTVNHSLSTAAGGTFAMTTFQLLGSLTSVTHEGTLTTTCVANPAIPSGLDWSGTLGGSLVTFAATTTSQFLPTGTYNNLTGASTTGTLTVVGGNLTVNGTLTTSGAAGTLDMGTNDLILGGSGVLTINGTGKLKTQSLSSTPIPSGKTLAGTVLYNALTGGQTVVSETSYTNLTLSNTSSSSTAGGDINVTGVLTTTAGGALDMSTFALTVGGAPVNGGTIFTQNTGATPISSGVTWGGTINYNGTGNQTIVPGTYATLALSGARASTPAITLAAGAINVSGNFNVTYTGAVTFSNTGNTFTYTGNTANTVGGIEYYDLVLGNSSLAKTAGGNITVDHNLTTTSGGTFAMSTFQLLGNPNVITHNGIITTSSTANPALPDGEDWSGGTTGTVQFALTTGGQFISTGTYKTLTCSNTSNTNTVVGATGNVTVTGTITTSAAGGTLDMGANDLLAGTVTNTGTILTQSSSSLPLPSGLTWAGTVNYNGTGNQTMVPGTFTTLTLSGARASTPAITLAAGTINLSGNFNVTYTGAVTFSNTGNTFNYSSNTANTVGGIEYYDLVLSNTTLAKTAGGNITVDHNLTTTSGGTFAMSTFQLLGNPNVITHNGIITTSSTANPALPDGEDWSGGTTGTVQFALTTGGQFISTGTYKTLTCSNTSNTNTVVGATGNVTVTGTITTSAAGGTLDMGANDLLAGTVTNTGTILTQSSSSLPLPSGLTWAGTVNYNGTGNQTMVPGTFTTLTLSGARASTPAITLAAGTINLSGNFNVTYTGAVTFSNTGNTFNYSSNTANTVGGIEYYDLVLSNTTLAKTAGGNITVDHSLTTTAGGTLAMSTFQLLGSPSTVTNGGTITTLSTASPAIPSGLDWSSGGTGVVQFASLTGGQFIPMGTYQALTCINTSGTNTQVTGRLTVNGTFTTSAAGGTYDMSTFRLVAGAVTNTGTLLTQNTNATIPLPAGLTWGGTVNYNGTTTQTIVNGNYNNLILSGVRTGSPAITLDGTGTISVTGTFTLSATGVGSYTTTGNTFAYNTLAGGKTIYSAIPYYNLVSGNTSGTNSVDGDLTVNHAFTTTSGGTVSMTTHQLLFGGGFATLTHNGTLTTSCIAPNQAIPSGDWSGTGGTSLVQYVPLTGNQLVASGTYKTLTCSNTSGTNTLTGGDLTVVGTFTTSAAGGTFDMATNNLVSAAAVTNTGTILTQSTSSTPFPSGLTWAGTVNYNGTDNQTIVPATYTTLTLSGVRNLTTPTITLGAGSINLTGNFNVTYTNPVIFSNTGNTFTYSSNTANTVGGIEYYDLVLGNTTLAKTAGGAVTVDHSLTTTSGGTFAMSTFQLLGSPTTITHNGTITTSCTANPALPAGNDWSGGTTGLVQFALLTGNQFVPTGTFKTLTCSNTSNTNTLVGGDLAVTGTFTTSAAGGTFDLVTNRLLAAGAITNTGTLLTQNTSATPIPTGFALAGTVNYNAATGGQTIVSETSYTTLKLTNTSGTNTVLGDINVTGVLTTTAGGTLDMGTNQLITGGSPSNSGTILTQNTGATPLSSGKNWSGVGSAGVVNYNASGGGQTIMAGTYSTLSLGSGGVTTTDAASGAISVSTALNIPAGQTFDMGVNALGGTLTTIANDGVLQTENTGTTPFTTGKTYGGVGIVKYSTGSVKVMAGTYNNDLIVDNSGLTNTATGAVVVNGALTVTAGSTMAMSTFQMQGAPTSVSNNGTITTTCTSVTGLALPTALDWSGGLSGTGVVTFAATTGNQLIPTGTYRNLNCTNTSGTNTVTGGDLVVNNAITTSSVGGTLDMGTNALIGTLTTITNSGTLKTQNTSSTPIPAGYATWGGTVNYNGTDNQTMVTGTFTNLTLSGARSLTTPTITLQSGNINLSGNFTVNYTGGPVAFSNTGNIFTYTSNTANTVGGIEYYDLALNNSSLAKTAGGNITVDHSLTTTSGGTFAMTTFQLAGSPVSLTHNGTLTTTCTANPAIFDGMDWSGTGGTSLVQFAATTGNQFISTGTYKTLTCSNTSNTNTVVGAAGNVTVTGTVTTSGAGGTLDMGANDLIAGAVTTNATGTILTQSTSSLPLPSGFTYLGTVNYNGTGNQTMVCGKFTNLVLSGARVSTPTVTLEGSGVSAITGDSISVSGNFTVSYTGSVNFDPTGNIFAYTGNTANTVGGITYETLDLDNTSSTKTAGGPITVNSFLQTLSGGTFAMGTNQLLGGTFFDAQHDGTLTTSCTASTAIPASSFWSGTGGVSAVIFNSLTGGQFIPGGSIFKTLTCTNTSGTNTVVGGDLAVTTFTASGAGGTLDMGTNKLTAATLTIPATGTLLTQCTATIPIPASKALGGTVNYNAAAGGQNVVFETSYTNLVIGNTSGTQTATGNLAVNGTLTSTTGGTLDMGSFTLTGMSGFATAGAGLSAGTIKTANTSAAPIKTGIVWAPTIVYYKSTGGQTIMAGTYNGGLTNSNTSGTNTVAAALTINGALTLNAGSNFTDNTKTITLNGNIAGTGTHTSSGAGKITMNTGGTTISGATLGNLTLNNAGGFSLTGDPTVTGTLTLSSGVLTLGSNNLILGTAAPTVAGTFSGTTKIATSIASGGQVRKLYNATGSYVFPIGGTGSNYTPITVNVTSGTFGGGAYVGVNLDNVQDPHDASTTDYISRYWKVTTNAVTTPVYSVTASYAAGDVHGTETNLSSGSYSGSLPWTKYAAVDAIGHTISATNVTTTSTEFTGITTSGPSVTNITAAPSSTICSGNSTTLTVNGGSAAVAPLSYSWNPGTGLSSTTASVVTASPTTTGTVTTVYVYTVTLTDGNGATALTTTTVTVNPAPDPGTITGLSNTVPTGYTISLTDATAGGVWSSDNTTVATVSGTGDVTGVSAGTATISYTLTNPCGTAAATDVITVTGGGTWYSVTTGGDASVLTDWWSTNSNTGIHPSVFTNASDTWVVQSAMSCTAVPFTLAGSVNIISGGNLTAPAGLLNVGGNWSNVGGTFTHNSGTVVFNSTSTGNTISGTLTGSSKFNNLTFAGVGGDWSFGSNSADLAGDFTITNGTVTAPSATLSVGGNWSNSGTFTNNGGGVTMISTTSGKTIAGSMTGSNAFNNLTFNGIGGGWSFGSAAADVNGDYTITHGTVTAPSSTLQVAGSMSNGGTFTNNSGTVVMSAVSAKSISGSWTSSNKFNNLTFNGVAGSWTLPSSLDLAGDFTITNGSVTAPSNNLKVAGNWSNGGSFTNNGGNVIMNAASGSKTLSGSMTGSNGFSNLSFNGSSAAWSFGANAADVSGDFTITAGAVTAPSSTLQVTGNWDNTAGTFTHNGGTVVMKATGAASISGAMTGSSKFNNLTFDGVGGSWSFASTATDVAGDFTITNGAVTAPSSSLQVGGNWSNGGTFTNNSGSVTMTSTSSVAFSGAMTGSNKFNNLVFNGIGGSWTFGANAADVDGNFTITNGSVTAPSSTLQVGGSWSNGGTFTNNGGALVMYATTTGKTLGGSMTGSNGFNTLTFNGVGGAWTFGSNAADVAGNFAITNGTVTAPSSTLTVVGNWNNAGTFTNNGGTVTLTATGAAALSGTLTGASKFNNLTFNGIGGSWTFPANADLNGNFTITNGSVTAPSSTLKVGGNWSNGGSFTNNGGTLVMTATTTGKTLTGSMTGSDKFNSLTFDGVGGAWSFGANAADVNGTLTITNGTVTGPSSTLNLNGDFLSSGGSYSPNGGTAVLTNSGAQQLGSTGGPAITFYNLTNSVSGTKTCNAGVNITGTLTPGGTAVLASGGFLTMKSTSSQTSNIAIGSSAGGYVTGDVTVERYIPANATREWRALAVPTNSATQTIQQAWQEGATSVSSDPNPGYGTGITCWLNYSTTDGFDEQSSGTINSIEQYDQASGTWTANPVTNTNVKLISSQSAYFLFIKGNRTSKLSNTTITATTLRTTGALYTGDQSAIAVAASKLAFVGNPYPSAIDFSAIAGGDRTNINNKFWVWDPKLSTQGGYQLFDAASGFTPVPGGGSYGSGANSIIQSGQAFFVQATGTAGSLQLREAIKVSGSNSGVFRSASDNEVLNINLNMVEKNDSTTLADGVRAIFSENASEAIDGDDGIKLSNVNENLSILRNQSLLMLEQRPLVEKTDTVFLHTENMEYRKYQLYLSAKNFNRPGTTAFLYDSYTGKTTSLNLEGDSKYNFTVDANSGSSVANRFMVVFNYNPIAKNVENGIVLYPNPAESEGTINLLLRNQLKGTYKLNLLNEQGYSIFNSEFQHAGGDISHPVSLPSMAPGIYNFEIVKPDLTKLTIKTLIK